MVMYMDSAILSGLIMNYICLDTAAGVTGVKVKKTRLILSSFILAVASVLCIFSKTFKVICLILYIPALWLILGKCSLVELLRRVGICLGCTFICSALILALIPPDRLEIIVSGEESFFVADDIYFYIPLAFVYALAKLILFCISKTKLIYSVSLTVDGQKVTSYALIDTGNSLRDKETGKPVVIAERALFENITSSPKIIGYKNIGKEPQYTYIYPVEKLSFTDENREYDDVYVTFVDKPLSASGKYKILLHNSFLI